MMDETAIFAIRDLAVQSVAVETRKTDAGLEVYRNGSGGIVPVPRLEPQAAAVTTLEGVAELVNAIPRDVIVHVEAFDRVGVYTADEYRDCLVTASCAVPQRYHNAMPIEALLLYLQTHFGATSNRDLLGAFLSRVTASRVVTAADDGFSQSVETKTGTVGVEAANVPNPIGLEPFGTFPEVPRVARQFVVRLHGGSEDRLPDVSLTLIEDPAIEHDARTAVGAWLSDRVELPVRVVV